MKRSQESCAGRRVSEPPWASIPAGLHHDFTSQGHCMTDCHIQQRSRDPDQGHTISGVAGSSSLLKGGSSSPFHHDPPLSPHQPSLPCRQQHCRSMTILPLLVSSASFGPYRLSMPHLRIPLLSHRALAWAPQSYGYDLTVSRQAGTRT